MPDYLQYKELTAKTTAKQANVDELSKAVNLSIMNKVKIQLLHQSHGLQNTGKTIALTYFLW